MKLARRALACSVVAVAAIACGARGPLDDSLDDGTAPGSSSNVTADGGSSTTPGPVGTVTTPSSPGSGAIDSGAPAVTDDGAAPTLPIALPPGLADSGLVICGTCVETECSSSINACLADTTCTAELSCIATTCLGGALGGIGGLGGSSSGSSSGGTGASCLTSCASGGIAGLSSLLPILTCIEGTCGTQCGSLLGGLGGLGGLDIERPRDERGTAPANAGRLVFAAYPQLFSAN